MMRSWSIIAPSPYIVCIKSQCPADVYDENLSDTFESHGILEASAFEDSDGGRPHEV